ncbi:Leucine Rich Repeat [Seminavis robusta]|uniref:Leucine Rich Repeat n=1 Tax=Seminavis robusta TaxID=568900 RepID=A0A9N8F3Y6_9STRA|nr:Leucine Rich Repeat [Seminavis robusta]|eukprot:Sro3312_g346610.1 Leucine Rich Repeat (409) ;mRNA; f:1184-2518
MFLLGIGVFAVGIIVLVVIVSQSQKADAEATLTVSPSQVNLAALTFSPTSSLQGYIYGILPDYTIGALDELESPQSKAFTWLLEDLSLTSYYVEQEWRVLQRFAFATLYYSTGGPYWTKNDNWLSHVHHECTWYGSNSVAIPLRSGSQYFAVEHPNPCQLSNTTAIHHDKQGSDGIQDADVEYDAYKQLWLHRNNLTGHFPKEMFLLTSLKTMSFFGGPIGGTLPPPIGNLQDLQAAIISMLPLTGSLPSEIGMLSNLAIAIMDRNRLTGSFPAEIGMLTNLEILLIDGNQLSGTLPHQISRLSKLETLYLGSNSLSGTIPTEIGQLTSLGAFPVNNNALTGTIPSEIGNLNALTSLLLEGNKLTGTIPKEMTNFDPPQGAVYGFKLPNWIATNRIWAPLVLDANSPE